MTAKELIKTLAKMDPDLEVLVQVGDEFSDYPFVRLESVLENELMFNGDNIKPRSYGFVEPHAVKGQAVVIKTMR